MNRLTALLRRRRRLLALTVKCSAASMIALTIATIALLPSSDESTPLLSPIGCCYILMLVSAGVMTLAGFAWLAGEEGGGTPQAPHVAAGPDIRSFVYTGMVVHPDMLEHVAGAARTRPGFTLGQGLSGVPIFTCEAVGRGHAIMLSQALSETGFVVPTDFIRVQDREGKPAMPFWKAAVE